MKISLTTRICAVIVFLALIVLGLLIGIGVYTNGFQSIKSRYISYNGAALKSDSCIELNESSPELKLTGAGFKFVAWGDTKFKITVNPMAKVTCSIGNGEVQSLDNADVTENFKISRKGQVVTIEEGDYSIETVTQNLHSKNAKLQYEPKEPLYIMTVTDEKGKEYSFMMKYTIEADGIEVDPDKVISG